MFCLISKYFQSLCSGLWFLSPTIYPFHVIIPSSFFTLPSVYKLWINLIPSCLKVKHKPMKELITLDNQKNRIPWTQCEVQRYELAQWKPVRCSGIFKLYFFSCGSWTWNQVGMGNWLDTMKTENEAMLMPEPRDTMQKSFMLWMQPSQKPHLPWNFNYNWLHSPLSFPGSPSDKELICQCRRQKRCRFDPWVRKIPWRRKRQHTPVFLPRESHEQRSLAGYSLLGHRVRHDWSNLACTYPLYL